MNIIIKYLCFFILLLNLIQVSKEENSIQFIGSKNEEKFTGNANNIIIQKDHQLSEYKQMGIFNNIDDSIWNTYEINKNEGIQIIFKPFKGLKMQNHQQLEIILTSNTDSNQFHQKKRLKFNNITITFLFDLQKNPLKKNEIFLDCSINNSIKGKNSEISSNKKNSCNFHFSDFNVVFIIEIINQKLLIKTNTGKIIYIEEFKEIKNMINNNNKIKVGIIPSIINKEIIINEIKVNIVKEYLKRSKSIKKLKSEIFNDKYKEIYNNVGNNKFKLRKLDGTNSITITLEGPMTNAKIINASFASLPDHVFLNDDSTDLGKISSINLEKEGTNIITMTWDSTITSCKNMFGFCSSINSIDLSNFITSSATTMNTMFQFCTSLSSINLSNINTKSLKNMDSMFKGCSSLASIDLSGINTYKVTNMENMFQGCTSLLSLDLSGFNTSSLTNMNYMFRDCSSLISLNLHNFNATKVTKMEAAFQNCSSLLSLDLSSFYTKSLTNMDTLFKDCSSLVSLNIANFDTKSLNRMISIFNGCSSLASLDISHFDTSSVTNMNSMFLGCNALTSLELANFNTSKVTIMISMFKDCYSLTSLDLSNFDTKNVGNMEYMFYGCKSIKSLDLSNFYTPSLKTMNHLFNGCSSLISLDISNLNTSSVNNMNYVFKDCSSLTSLDLTKFDTSSIRSMQGIFQSCSSLTSLDLSNYDTSSITSMFNMFLNCISLELLNISNFYILNKTDIRDIFKNCTSLRVVDLTNFFSEKSIDIFEGFDSLVVVNRTTENNNENKNSDELELTQEVNGDGINFYEELSSVHIHDIIHNLDDLIRDKDQKETHIMNGIDYTVIIKPINDYVEESTVHVDLSECEKILKQRDSSKNFSILQINKKNKNKRSLVDQVEYKIYDNEQNEVDLSVCESIPIKIQYKITNSSLINLEQVKYFNEKGIDIFDINDNFFNDICYPYSDTNSNSDMVLSDRISDIYQNLSICGKECEYNSFNTDNQVVNCDCKIKKEVSSEAEEDNLVNYIENTFLDSNFGVIKCYNLVFGIKNKLKNIGFWIFGILTIAHIPIYAFYFINGINPVKKFIRKEMSNKGYMPKNIHIYKRPRESIKKVINVSHRENSNSNNPPNKKSNNNDNNNNIYNIDKLNFNNNIINNAPPKKVVKIKIKKKKKVPKNVIENEDQMNDQNVNNDILIIEEEDKNENMDGRYLSKKRTFNFSSKKNNLISRTDLDELIAKADDKNNKKLSRKSLNVTSITTSQNYSEKNTERNMKTEEIKNKKNENDYPLILINANNVENYELLKSNLILNNYNYDEAIKYDNRSFIRILFIFLISKDNLLNIIFFNPPLELRPLRICIFIFNYACDLALNALFYLSKNISDKYHYTGPNKIIYSLINNLTKSLTSSIVSFILLYFFQSLTQSSNNIEKLFRNQEDLLKNDKKYKVEEDTKRKIEKDIRKILKCLKIKIICFIVFESIFMLFFFYYVTAFCQVYLSTQTSWILDSLTSYLISFLISLTLSLILTILYKVSLYNQIKILYIISMFIYS